jgi:hypothetical protein
MSVILEHMRNKKDKGVILACAHSNSVINDWIRKIVRKQSPSQLSNNINGNTIIDSSGIIIFF